MKKVFLILLFCLLSVFCFSQSKMYTVHKDFSVDSVLISDISRIYFKVDTSSTVITTDTATVTDIDGNIYHTVTIGTQTWMVENLKTTKYRNGDPIPNVTDGETWGNLTTDAYCHNNNDGNNVDTYGRLYNKFAVNDIRKIAPTGWHVATDEEWTTLINFVGGESVAGTKLKSKIGWFDNGNGTDDYGFTALPGGYRSYNGAFFNIGADGHYWSSTEGGSGNAWSRSMIYYGTNINRDLFSKRGGFSVRCIKD